MSKILLLTFEFSPFHGGVGTYAEMLAHAAHDLGHQVTVLAPDYGQRLSAADRASHPFEIIRFSGSRYSAADTPATAWRTWRAIHRDRYDVIHAVDLAHLVGLELISRFEPVSYRATVHGSEILSVNHSRQSRVLRLQHVFNAPSLIYTNSEYTRRLLLSRYPAVEASRVRPTLLGVEPYWFASPDGDELPRELKLPPGRRIVLTVSRLEPRKGHRTVIKALGLMARRFRNEIVYVVVGTGIYPDYRAELERLAAGCGVPVVFTGEIARAELRKLYGMAEIFCMPGEPDPTSVEGFGLAYLEAAAQGVPAVAATIGGVPEVVRDGETGVLVPPSSPVSVAMALEALLDNPDRTRALGTKAQLWARDFTWARCAAESYGVVR